MQCACIVIGWNKPTAVIRFTAFVAAADTVTLAENLGRFHAEWKRG